MQLKAIIFDVDGTIADTEQFGHLPACNAAMKEMGLEIEWTWEEYIKMLHTIPGNVNRLKNVLQKKGFEKDQIETLASQFAPLKKSFYIHQFLAELKLRAGIENIIKECIANDVRLAIVSTSYETQIKALLNFHLNKYQKYFHPVLGKETGKKTNNDGWLHKQCLGILKINPRETIVIEDAKDGLEAAQCANIPTAVFYNDYTYGSAFKGAKLVAPSLEHFNLKQLQHILL